MKADNSFEMGDPTDQYIHRAVRNWAARQRPRANGRARLLRLATAPRQLPPLPSEGIYSYLEILNPMVAPADKAFEIYDLSWLLSAQFSLARLGKVT